MKWINLQEQPPEIDSIVLVEYINGEYGKIEYLGDSEWWNKNVAKWLDEESSDPLFSADDLKEYGLACLEWAVGNRTEKPNEFLKRVHNIG